MTNRNSCCKCTELGHELCHMFFFLGRNKFTIEKSAWFLKLVFIQWTMPTCFFSCTLSYFLSVELKLHFLSLDSGCGGECSVREQEGSELVAALASWFWLSIVIVCSWVAPAVQCGASCHPAAAAGTLVPSSTAANSLASSTGASRNAA